MFSGYRAFTRRFVKSFPAISTGFEVEAELSVHAAQLMIPVAEIGLSDAPETEPPAAHLVKKGLSAAKTLAMLLKETRPATFYFGVAALFWLAGLFVSLWAGDMLAVSAASALFVIGFVSAACGLVLDSLSRARVEQKRILFLTVPALGAQ